MLTKLTAIDEGAREVIQRDLDNHFSFREGSDLDSVIDEVTHDRDLFTFLAAFLPNNKGIRLSHMSYYDDIDVFVNYGITIDWDNLPRRTTLFTYETIGAPTAILDLGRKVSLFSHLPDYSEKGGCQDYPSPESFIKRVNSVLRDPKKFLITLR